MRTIKRIFTAIPTIEGAGVHLKRGFAHQEVREFDPFLLFDDFSNTDPTAYEAGFPLHPHRGMETVTYIITGEVDHKDSLGNAGSITDGCVQWMTAGSGIVHEEMPVVKDSGILGFQLWVNLPREHKMMPPRYQEIGRDAIPEVKEDGVLVRVIAGLYRESRGPAQDLMVSPTYLDVTLDPGASFSLPTNEEENFFAYVFEGEMHIGGLRVGAGEVALLTHDHEFGSTSGSDGARFLLIGGTPLDEPIAWHGPIVMNTDEEIRTALRELQSGTFIT